MACLASLTSTRFHSSLVVIVTITKFIINIKDRSEESVKGNPQVQKSADQAWTCGYVGMLRHVKIVTKVALICIDTVVAF